MDQVSQMMSQYLNGKTIGASLIVCVIMLIAVWKIFTKAGEAGWKCLIPFYNTYTQVKIVDGNGWKFLLLLIPVVHFVYSIMLTVRMAKSFGKGGGFAVGLIFLAPIFFLILAFGSAQYIGPRGEGMQTPSQQ